MTEKNKNYLIVAVSIVIGLAIIMLPAVYENKQAKEKEITQKDSFVYGCSTQDGMTEEECECVYEEVKNQIGETGITYLSEEYGSDIPETIMDTLLTENVMACVE